MDPLAAARGEPELAQWLPIDLGGAIGIEPRERRPATRRGIDSDDLGRIRRTLPHGCDLERCAPPRRRCSDLQTAERAARHGADFQFFSTCRRRAKQPLVARILGQEKDGAVVGRDRVTTDRVIGATGHGAHRCGPVRWP